MTKAIATKRAKIKAKIQVLNDDLRKLQSECLHENATHVHKGSTGNYDPSCDSYWVEHGCPDCDKFWTTEK